MTQKQPNFFFFFFFATMISTHMRLPVNTYQGKEAPRGKQFLLNVITSLIWDFFRMAISLLAYVATFSGQLYFRRNYFFTLFQSNYFDTTVIFSEQLALQRCHFFSRSFLFHNSHFFAAVIFF